MFGSLLAAAGARAIPLPEDRAELMYHQYTGGGMTANGPALFVRKSVADRFSISATYYIDAVSNASIDVVTTASPYRERRIEYGLSADYVYRDSQITLSASTSKEPDYQADAAGLDVSQEVFGGMTTVSLGFSRGSDKVGKSDSPEFSDSAKRWQYRVGVSQILTPRWIMSANVEAIAESGFLGNPYRAARVFGAAVPERMPRTRSSRAIKFRLIGDLGSRDSIHAEYRYFRDTWKIQGHTAEIGYSRYFGDAWLADAYLRYYTQQGALFYSDNATSETVYVSRARQLSGFNNAGFGAKLSYTVRRVPGQYELKLNGGYELIRFNYGEYTDLRTGNAYKHNGNVLQLFVSATF